MLDVKLDFFFFSSCCQEHVRRNCDMIVVRDIVPKLIIY